MRLAAVILVLALAGCAGQKSADPGHSGAANHARSSTTIPKPDASTQRDLARSRWVPVAVETGNRTVPVASARSVYNRAWITFYGANDSFTARDGCNDLFGSAVIAPTTVLIRVKGSSAVGCRDLQKA